MSEAPEPILSTWASVAIVVVTTIVGLAVIVLAAIGVNALLS